MIPQRPPTFTEFIVCVQPVLGVHGGAPIHSKSLTGITVNTRVKDLNSTTGTTPDTATGTPNTVQEHSDHSQA